MMSDLKSIQKPYLFSENGGIGDAFINLPAIRAFNHIFGGKLTLITSEFNKHLYQAENFPSIKILPLKFTKTDDGNAFDFDLEVLKDYLADADYFIDMNTWYLETGGYDVFIRSLKIPTVGPFRFFQKNEYPNFSINSFDTSFNLIKFIDPSVKIDDFSYPPALTKEVKEFVDRTKQSFPDDVIILGIQDETKADKMWRTGRFEELINGLLSRYSNVAVLILSRKTAINFDIITEKNRVLYFESPLDFGGMVGMVSIVDYFIGIDSVFLHLADLFRIPSIGLFGPTNHKEWGFRFTKGIEIVSTTGSMVDILVEEVMRGAIKLFEEND